MASTSQTVDSLKMDSEKIRKTDEKPSRVSVIEIIAVFSKVKNPRDVWFDLQRTHPEVVADSDNYNSDFKFPGRRQRGTPVIDARGAIMIINLLPGAMAASFRAAWADIIVRYIGGDTTLKAEIEKNDAIQNELPKNDPMRIFREDVEARHIPRSVTGVQDIKSAQIYFGIAGPPEVWTDIMRTDGTPYTLKENEFLMKTGYHDENTGRYGQHVNEYGFFRLSDSVLGRNPRLAEQKFKGWLRNENLLLSARHVNKTTRDTELIAVTLVRYKETVGKAIEFFRSDDNKVVDIDYERELTKRTISNNDVQREVLQSEVQKLQIQLEMLRLEKNVDRESKQLQLATCIPHPSGTQVHLDNSTIKKDVRGKCAKQAVARRKNTREESIYALFSRHFIEKSANRHNGIALNHVKARWPAFARLMVELGYYQIAPPMPKLQALKEGLANCLRTECEERAQIHGHGHYSVFKGFKLAMPETT